MTAASILNIQTKILTLFIDPYFVLYFWQNLKEENITLASELKTVKERTAGEGQEAPSKQPVGEALQKSPVDDVQKNAVDQAEHERM